MGFNNRWVSTKIPQIVLLFIYIIFDIVRYDSLFFLNNQSFIIFQIDLCLLFQRV